MQKRERKNQAEDSVKGNKMSENKNSKDNFKDLKYNKNKIMRGKMIAKRKPENHARYIVRKC